MQEQLMTDLTLSHYTIYPLLLEDREYEQFVDEPYAKPRGLWVSCDGEDDWKEWCEQEDFHIGHLEVRNVIRLKSEANVLILKSAEDLYAFSEEYGSAFFDRNKIAIINWHRVSTEYDGIIIAPYIWECRLNNKTSWYYGWDCASGCIWNLNVIEVV